MAGKDPTYGLDICPNFCIFFYGSPRFVLKRTVKFSALCCSELVFVSVGTFKNFAAPLGVYSMGLYKGSHKKTMKFWTLSEKREVCTAAKLFIEKKYGHVYRGGALEFLVRNSFFV